MTLEQQQNRKPLTTHGPLAGAAFLSRIVLDGAALEWLIFYAKKAREEIARSNADQLKAIEPLIGNLLIDGKPLQFTPDPWAEKGARPESEITSEFAINMVRCYRWMGGEADFHKLGTGLDDPEPTPFMRFLAAIKKAVPAQYRPVGDSFLWRSIEWLENERKAT